jgi:DNA-binding NarL/FixJ family response regulator
MNDVIKILIADDHPPTRAGVRASLEGAGFEVCAEVGDAKAAVKAAAAEKPDVCLLDVNMPGGGINAARQISAMGNIAVVMLTVSRNDDDLFDSLRAGAAGYLLKDTDPDRLPHALKGVLSGEAALPRGLVSRLIDEFRGRGRRAPFFGKRTAELTSREWEVLEMLRESLSTEEIAARMFISPVTVRSHVSAILRKLNVPDRQAALRLLEEQTPDQGP